MTEKSEQAIMQNWLSDQPLVSICCVTFNQESYIADALDGFLIQETNFAFEIIVRDDCSSDQTAAIVKQYADKYQNIIKPIFESSNQYSKGIQPFPAVMNRSIGKYIAICEGDDFWTDPTKLQNQIDFLEQHPDYSLIFHNAEIRDYDYNGVVIDTRPHTTNIPTGEVSVAQVLMNKIVPTASVVLRNVDLSYYFSKKYPVGDTPLFMYMAKFGRLYYSDEITSVYRLLTTGMVKSQLNTMKKHSAFIPYYKDLQKEFSEFDIDETIDKSIARKYMLTIIAAIKEKEYLSLLHYLLFFLFLYPKDFLKMADEVLNKAYIKFTKKGTQ